MRFLITGAAGFLARPLARELRRRYPRGKIVKTDLLRGPGLLACDLLKPAETIALIRRARPDLVFHMAGTTRPVGAEALWMTHVRTTVNLLEAVRLAQGEKSAAVVLSGSSAEYGRVRGTATERSPSCPMADYGRSKHDQTTAALRYARHGMRVLVARIFNVSGPGIPAHLAPGAFARQIAKIAKGPRRGRVMTGNLNPRRDYLDVRDAARALIDIGRLGRSGETYNVCSGRTLSMRELLDELIAASGCRIEVIPDPKRVKKSDLPVLAGSHAKLTRLTRWTPRIPIRRSLRDTLEWYLRGKRRTDRPRGCRASCG